MKINYALVLILAGWLCCGTTLAEVPPPVPDLTNGGTRDAKHDWTLGPTGARGWIWGWRGQTTNARQILITDVAPGSPSDRLLQKDDVLLGINGKPFNDDARIAFAKAITEAEKKTGILSLMRWRGGQTEKVQITLAVMGEYSETAPFDCEKSKRILEQGCAAIAKAGFKDKNGVVQIEIANALRALALLACGHAEYRPLIAEYARAVAVCTPSQGGHKSWDWGYQTLFLAEYELATKDPSVMPGLTRLATDLARGASNFGTWGHTFALPSGILKDYGAMNAVGVPNTLALVVARDAGVKDADVDRTIAASARFLRWFVGKGALPYGDTYPQMWHEDNGKCACAAILFDALGDREAAGFFSRMATAGYAEREAGHTGNFFSMLWSLLGIARSGPLASGAYLKETDWYYDLARGWDGRFFFQGAPANWGGMAETGWDCTGAYMLSYAMPFRLTILTGRKPSVAPALSRDEVTQTIAAGRDFSFWTMESPYEGRSTEALFEGLSSWSPPVRKRSASALGRREGDFVPRVLKLLDAPSRDAQCGACEALACLGPKADPAAGRLRELLASANTDPWLRILAAEAIGRLGRQERTAAIPDLLRAVVFEDPADPRKTIQAILADALFTGGPDYFFLPSEKRDPKPILSGSLDGVDRPSLYAAIRDILKNDNGWVVQQVAPVYKLLTPHDAAALMPDILTAIRKPPASGEMFSSRIRIAGCELLARLRLREGMELAVDNMPEEFGWHRAGRIINAMACYGGAAREYLPRLREIRRFYAAREADHKDFPAFDKMIADIEADPHPPTLQSAAEFIESQTKLGFINSIGMTLVRIAPGEFMMGSPPTEIGRELNETQHKVKITRGFMMGATCVTQGQWKAVMGTTLVQQRDKYNPHWILAGEGDDIPMYYVSWDEAALFCKKLSDKEKKHYRLPTEAEWEYACRAGTTGPFGGTGDIDDMAWYADNSGDRRIDSFAIFNAKVHPEDYDRQIFKNHCRTHPVATKKPNAWGLYDMHGNVYEWCSDYFGDYPATDAADPAGPKKGEDRVVRGGSFFVFPRWCRSASRDSYRGDLPEHRIVGFRVSLD